MVTPIIHLFFPTANAKILEKNFHTEMENFRVRGRGREWYNIPLNKIISKILLLDSVTPKISNDFITIPMQISEKNFQNQCPVATNDDVQKFLNENIEWKEEDSMRIKASILYNLYKIWCNSNSIQPTSQTKFGKNLLVKGYKKKKTSGIIIYMNISLKEEKIIPS